MGRAFADASRTARDVFAELDEALGQHLTRLMFDGPESELMLTANAQPAIMAVSVAAMAVMVRDAGLELSGPASFVAGHSLGEYSALCAAGSFDILQAARLLRLRGQSMQAAVPPGEGGMAAILGLELAAVEQVVADAQSEGTCAVANDNAPGQVVISGHIAAIERAILLAKDAGARRAMQLAVSAPFHCSLMEPAARAMEEALGETVIRAPVVPVVANVTADIATDPAHIHALLVEQMTGRVRWRESIEYMAGHGVTRMVELGARVVGPMVKRITPDIDAMSITGPDDIEALLKLM